MFTPDVRVWGANAFCYLPLSLKEEIRIVASRLGSNDTLFVQHFKYTSPPSEFVTVSLNSSLKGPSQMFTSHVNMDTWRLIYVKWGGKVLCKMRQDTTDLSQRAADVFKISQVFAIY